MGLSLLYGHVLPWYQFLHLLNKAQALVPQPAGIQDVLIYGES